MRGRGAGLSVDTHAGERVKHFLFMIPVSGEEWWGGGLRALASALGYWCLG